MRKNDDDLRNAIDSIIVPTFSSTFIEAEPDKKQKMNKVIDIVLFDIDFQLIFIFILY